MRKLAVVLICMSFLQQAFGWGDEGHRAINRAAAGKLPAEMPAFLRGAAERIEYLGPEPDRWRHQEEFALKNSQEPDHFIDLERVADVPQLPPGRYQFYELLYEKRAALLARRSVHPRQGPPPATTGMDLANPDDLLPERVGLQPYITLEVYDRLKVAFREYRYLKSQGQKTEAVEQNIVFYMGWLGHYVGDAANPLHTTVKYNGWVGDNPNGYTTEHRIHWMMEGPFVGDNLARMPLLGLLQPPAKLQNPWQDYLAFLWSSHALVEKCYQLEKTGGFIGEGTAESREFIRRRLAAGAQMLANMWYTAWKESEKAVVSGQWPVVSTQDSFQFPVSGFQMRTGHSTLPLETGNSKLETGLLNTDH